MKTNILKLFIIALCLFAYSITSQAQCKFTNPLGNAAPDPWVIQNNGYYYFTYTTGGDVKIKRSLTLQGISNGAVANVWSAPGGSQLNKDIWAPELHYIKGKWYIISCGVGNASTDHDVFVLEGTTQNPMDPFVFKGTLAKGIDATYLEAKNGTLYMIWSYYNPDQRLYISKMSNPWTLTGSYVELSRAQYSWEMIGANINEGPEILQHGNKTMLIYSASGSWTKDYCLGMLYCDNEDFINPNAWTKLNYPVFSSSDANGIWGPGHASFTTSKGGKENWIVYHAKNTNGGAWDNRTPHLQPFVYDQDGLAIFGSPLPENFSMYCPEETPILTDGQSYIITGRQSGKVCGIDANVNVRQETYINSESQKWVVHSIGGGFYGFVNLQSGKQMEVASMSKNNGANVMQWANLGNDGQQWRLEHVTGEWYYVINKNSEKVLDVTNLSLADNANIQQYDNLGGLNQQWSFTPVPIVTTQIKNVNSNNYISIYPNPANSQLTVFIGDYLMDKIKINDLQGRVIYEDNKIYKNQKQIDVSNLSKGIYFIHLTYNHQEEVRKIVID